MRKEENLSSFKDGGLEMFCPECGKQIDDDSKFCEHCGNLIESDLKEEIPIRGDKFIPNVYAGFWRRVLAHLIDFVILIICSIPLVFLEDFMASVGMDIEDVNVQSLALVLNWFIGFIISWLYYTLFESSSKQGTPGKMAIGIIVTDLNGQKISFGKANGRYWGKMVSAIILGIGFIMAGTTPKKQALHDIMAGTIVLVKMNREMYNSILIRQPAESRATRPGMSVAAKVIIAIVNIFVLTGIVAAIVIGNFYIQKKSQVASPTLSVNPPLADVITREEPVLSLPNNEAAMKELFGVSGPSGKVKTAHDKLTDFWFEQSFKVGTDNLHVKFFATQSLDESGQPVDYRAASVDVGAITYKQNAGQWEVISKQPQFGYAGSSGEAGEAKTEVLQLSPNSIAIMLDASGSGQGYFYEGKTVFVYAQNSWHDTGFVQTGANNSGTCDDTPPLPGEEGMGACHSYKGVISVVKGSMSDYPDLLVTRTGTDIQWQPRAIIPANNITYIFKDGKYINPNEPN